MINRNQEYSEQIFTRVVRPKYQPHTSVFFSANLNSEKKKRILTFFTFNRPGRQILETDMVRTLNFCQLLSDLGPRISPFQQL